MAVGTRELGGGGGDCAARDIKMAFYLLSPSPFLPPTVPRQEEEEPILSAIRWLEL